MTISDERDTVMTDLMRALYNFAEEQNLEKCFLDGEYSKYRASAYQRLAHRLRGSRRPRGNSVATGFLPCRRPIRQKPGSSPKGAGAFSVHFCAYKSEPRGPGLGKPRKAEVWGRGGPLAAFPPARRRANLSPSARYAGPAGA